MKEKKLWGLLVGTLFTLLVAPSNAYAETMSDEFKEMLNDEGKLVIKAVEPKTEEEAMIILSDHLYLSEEKMYVNTETCNKDYTRCELVYNPGWQSENPERHEVDIIYDYNKDIKTMIDDYSKKIPEDLEYFEVKDMELVNYWVNGQDDVGNLISYSGELKSYLGYKNFNIDLRKGSNEPFYTIASGIADFTYDGVLYGVRNNTGVNAKHVIYVDEKTGDTKEDLIKAAQKRIDEYVGKNKVEVKYEGKGLYDFFVKDYDDEIASYQEQLDAELAKPEEERNMQFIMDCEFWIEQYQSYKDNFTESYNSKDGEYSFLKDAAGDYYFSITINSEEEQKYLFIIVKDNDKMVKPTYKTSDLNTDVTISSESSLIPLDTLIEVSKLTSGKVYEEIIKLLDVKESETFDVNLYSKSLEDYITELEDGTFEVKIPLIDNFKDKDLMVYYVDKDNKVHEHEVTKKDGYAIFTTDHFSIYTLAATSEILPPKTGDNIMIYFVIGIISVIGLLGVTIYLKKAKN